MITFLVIVAALLLLSALVTSWMTASSLVAPHPEAVGMPPADLPADSITLKSESGSCLVGWHIPSKQKRGVIVLAHPYQGSRLDMLNRARLLHSQGYAVVMTDLQAHGESPGENVTVGYLERHDITAAVGFAKSHYPAEPIGILGFSMGGAAALLAPPP